jgi:hypothetical protein
MKAFSLFFYRDFFSGDIIVGGFIPFGTGGLDSIACALGKKPMWSPLSEAHSQL